MVGRTVLHYQLLEKLGAGGMGEIYKAHDPRLNRFVAIKVLPASMSADADRRRRFFQEAQAASALNHPNIITIYDIITEGHTQFMVMEYVAGKTLLDLIPRTGMRAPLVLQYSVQMADALAAAHSAGIIHRDLKPSNIMVTDSGLVKLLDFGLAKLSDRGPGPQSDITATVMEAPLTVEGAIIGTVNYMSPEQAEGKKLDARSDIFSFGSVLYEMVTGRCPFHGESTVSTLSAVLRDEIRPISEVAPDVPAQLEQIIARCLYKDPDKRWQSMKEVNATLTALKRQSDSGVLYNRSTIAPLPPKGKPSKALVIGVVAAIVVAAGAGGWLLLRPHPAPAPTAAAVPATPPPADTRPSPLPTAPSTPAPSAAPSDTPITNDSILEMVKEKVPDSVILSQIRTSKTQFNLSSGEVIRLSKGGVSAPLIEAMRNPKATAPAVGDPSASTPATAASTPPAANPNPAEPPAPPPPSSAAVTSVNVVDGLPFKMTLTEDIPASADEGLALRFTVAEDVRVNDAVVLPRGAAVIGAIAEAGKKKMLGMGGKMTFRLTQADAVNGQKLAVRAMPSKRGDGPPRRPVEVGGRTKSKDIAAAAGSLFIGYIDGAQSVTVHPPLAK